MSDPLQDTGGWVRWNIAPILLWAPDWQRIRAWILEHPAFRAALPGGGGTQVSPNHREGALVCALIADDDPDPLAASLTKQLTTPWGLQGPEQLGYVNFWLGLWEAALLCSKERDHSELAALLERAIRALLAVMALHYDQGEVVAPGARRGWPAQGIEGVCVELAAGRHVRRHDAWWWANYNACARLLREVLRRHPESLGSLPAVAAGRLEGGQTEDDRTLGALLRETPLRWRLLWERREGGWWSYIEDLTEGGGWTTDPVDATAAPGREAIQWPAPPGASRLAMEGAKPVSVRIEPAVITIHRELPHYGLLSGTMPLPPGATLTRLKLGHPVARGA